MYLIFKLIIISIFIVSCGDKLKPDTIERIIIFDPAPENPYMENDFDENSINAKYRLEFNSSWSIDSHPTNFPLDPHFSGLIGAVHNDNFILWRNNTFASRGIKEMAELGSKFSLNKEMANPLENGDILSIINTNGINISPGSISVEFTMDKNHSLLSITSMLAPSPDWFIGVDSINLLENDLWLNKIEINLRLYDAGTDSGLTYESNNLETFPIELISRLNSNSNDSDFLEGLPYVGRFIINRIE